MAAPCRKFARSVLLRGLHLVPGRSLWTQHCQKTFPALSTGLVAPRCFPLLYRPLHFSPGPLLTSTGIKTDLPRSTDSQNTADAQRDDKKVTKEEEEEEDEGPEYIPKRKGKNPMMAIGYAWMIGLPAGVIGFILAKREVDKNRLKQLRIRQRMKRSNEGEYDGSRYGTATKLD